MQSDSGQKKQQVLRKRAEALSRLLTEEHMVENSTEMLIFTLANERYAVQTKYIQEVYPLRDYTPLPCAPAFIFGLINLRRKIVTVIDLKVLFELDDRSDSKEKKVVVLELGNQEFALLIDSLLGIQEIPVSQIDQNLPTLTGVRQDYLMGVSADRIAILDGEKLLTSKKLVVDESVEVTT